VRISAPSMRLQAFDLSASTRYNSKQSVRKLS
jgi:hypothetical protein